MRMLLVGIVVAWTAIGTGSTGAYAQPVLPPSLRAELERNARAIATLELTVRERTEALGEPEEVLSRLHLSHNSPQRFFREIERHLIWQDGMLFSESRSQRDDGVGTFQRAFDGEAYYAGEPGVVIIRMAPDRSQGTTQGQFGLGYLAPLGMQFPEKLEYLQGILHPQSSILALLGDGNPLLGVSMAAGERPLVTVSIAARNPVQERASQSDLAETEERLRGSMSSEEFIRDTLNRMRAQQNLPEMLELSFTLDPELGFAVTQIDERFPSGELLKRTTNHGFEWIESTEVWLPRLSVTDHYWWDTLGTDVLDEPIIRRTLHVDGEFSTEPVAAETFVLAYAEPGTVVHDRFLTEHEITFTVAAGAEDLAQAFLTLDPRFLRSRPQAWMAAQREHAARSDETEYRGSVAQGARPHADEARNSDEGREATQPRLHWAILIITAVVIIVALAVRRVVNPGRRTPVQEPG